MKLSIEEDSTKTRRRRLDVRPASQAITWDAAERQNAQGHTLWPQGRNRHDGNTHSAETLLGYSAEGDYATSKIRDLVAGSTCFRSCAGQKSCAGSRKASGAERAVQRAV